MKKIKFLSFLSFLIFSSALLFSSVGSTSLALLGTGSSAQIQGLAGAGVGMPNLDDSFYNPAGIATADYQQIKGGYHTGIAGMNSYAGNMLYSLKGKGVVSVGFQYWSLLQGLKIYDEVGALTGESIDANNMFLIVGYGYNKNKISFGLNGKYISESIGEKYSAFAVDAGIQYLASKEFVIGVMAADIGSAVAGDSLPANIIAGLSYIKDLGVKSAIRSMLFLGQFQYYFSGVTSYQVGLEVGFKHLKIQQSFASPYLRLGISPKSDLGGSLSMLTIGAGFLWDKIKIDYALNPYSDINEYHHTISLGYRFGTKEGQGTVQEIKKEMKEKKAESEEQKKEKKSLPADNAAAEEEF